MREIFISDRIGGERMPFIEQDLTLGQAHYSWKIISNLYRSGIQQSGYATRELMRPEIYQTEIARKIVGQTDGSIHFAVKPIEHLRPFPGAKNIYVCGWEFPEFSNNPGSLNPLHNQLRILSTADAIICWTDYIRDNLLAAGLNQARTLPPPIANPKQRGNDFLDSLSVSLAAYALNKGPSVEKLGSALSKLKPRKVFVTVLNPFDRRKQITTMLAGFLNALREDPDLVLIVKLVIDNVHTLVGNINEVLSVHHNFTGSSERILFIGDRLTDEDLAGLISTADYYLCTSSAEGLNIPLIEAQLLGVPAVSTWNTAMGTYLDSSCAIEIPSNRQPMTGQSHALADDLQVTHFPPEERGVASAITQASRIEADAYSCLSRAAKRNAQQRFGLELFSGRLEGLFSEIAAGGRQ